LRPTEAPSLRARARNSLVFSAPLVACMCCAADNFWFLSILSNCPLFPDVFPHPIPHPLWRRMPSLVPLLFGVSDVTTTARTGIQVSPRFRFACSPLR
jgi:hypothetical protein